MTRSSTRVCRALDPLLRYLDADSWRCLVLVLFGAIVRSPALQGQLIWDDQYLARSNPFIKSPVLILETFRHYLFMDSFSAHYRPIQTITYVFDYLVWGTNEFGYHVTNVLLHVVSSILLYFLLRRLLRSLLLRDVQPRSAQAAPQQLPWISRLAFLSALIWSVHPVHSAAIDYISGRADSLAFACASGGWLLFLKARETARTRAFCLYAGAMLLGVVAVLSREIAFIWMLLFFAHLFFVEKRNPRRCRIAASACGVAIIVVYVGLRSVPPARPLMPEPSGMSAPLRITLMARALGDYGRLMLFPSQLHMERTVLWTQPAGSDSDWRQTVGLEYLSILGLIVLGGLVIGCIKQGRGRPLRIFGAVWFLMAYLPVSNLVQLNATVAEHWLYLPSVGFILFSAGLLLDLPLSWRRPVLTFASVAVLALSVRSFIRSSDWVDEETFYNRTFTAGSRSARVAVNLGQLYTARKEYAKAEKLLRWVLEQNPEYPIAQNALASLMYQQGRLQEAEKLYAEIEKQSVETRKEYARTWVGAYNLALVLRQNHQEQSAIPLLEKARRDYPDVWEVVRLEAEIVSKTQSPEAALKLVEPFAQKNWWHYGAAFALGQLYAEAGDAARAEINFRRASRLDIHDAEALRAMAMMRVRENRLQDACETQRRAIARQPDQPRQYILLSDILQKMGRDEEARATLAQVSRLQKLAGSTKPAG